MSETTLYIVRHGKTMFNTIERVQGWCDTPLTKQGQEGIHFLGKGLKDIDFSYAYSSDSGRAIETARIVLSEHTKGKEIPYFIDKRIREWCFGSLEGGYDMEMWGVIPRVLNFQTYDEMFTTDVTFEQIANAIYETDTAGWAQPYDELKERVWSGFEDIAHQCEKNNGGNVLVVSHGLTIAFLLSLIDPSQPVRAGLLNGSVTKVTYKNGRFSIESVNDTSYIEQGKQQTRESFM
ncbi:MULTISPECIES: histidine phosphatase family protein [Enterococcus]|uniref:Histidine phosphatase family protein n=1 Tax=Enterococcus mundtii TaxID=53346 RepID=A0A2T5D9Y1_ENTMU|nr:histidine phosphatase family protein [Enterococcus mundtii]MBE6173744.1 histidine phosphatase family protein [Enterococcus faecium]MBO1087440.1 histidine phosphatase family protein [Enterococcus mundtii]MDB7102566.1 histidine phosphatase family protein [Enterococcus mundtii]MDV7746274.1 histidine phosphatase family protein [Enterococcus mundtii]PQC27381.1 histidine phosphatase family protein [Enterococcus mundtii]